MIPASASKSKVLGLTQQSAVRVSASSPGASLIMSWSSPSKRKAKPYLPTALRVHGIRCSVLPYGMHQAC